MRYDIEFAEVSDILDESLHTYLDNFQIASNQIGQAIFDTYFALKKVD